MTARKWLVVGLLFASTASSRAQFGGGGGTPANPANPADVPAPKPPAEDVPAPKPATSRVVAVTLYQTNALVTREVAVPEGKGAVEVVVTPLPPQTIEGSLSTEGPEGFRVLSTRYRTRAVKEDTREEVRSKQNELKTLEAEAASIRSALGVREEDLKFLAKLEAFTGSTMTTLTDKGKLDGEATIEVAKYVMETRASTSEGRVKLEDQARTNAESIAFVQRQLAELSAGSGRTEIDAVIVVDKANAPAGSVRLSYLVSGASWSPRYRVRAGGPKDPVRMETLGAVEQHSGEDWNDVDLTLSTAQPSYSATVPDLLPLDVSASESGQANKGGFQAMPPAQVAPTPAPPPMAPQQAQQMRSQAGRELLGNNAKAGGALLNQAAALDQSRELLADDSGKDAGAPPEDLPAVTFRVKGRLSLPSRKDPMFVEIGRAEMAPEYFAKAVPVLSPRVYRLAKLTNTGDSPILPGEATMYVGQDFVGRMTLPFVAVGEPFTVGFGVDSRLQIGRRLVNKTRTVQGGNQVMTYEFRIVARNFSDAPAKLHVWDRLPKPEGDSVAVSLSQTQPELSTDTIYQKTGRTDNLLRWDLDVPANTIGDKPMTITYSFKIEYAKEFEIDYFRSGGLSEAPIGGMGGLMGGMGGGFRSLGNDRP